MAEIKSKPEQLTQTSFGEGFNAEPTLDNGAVPQAERISVTPEKFPHVYRLSDASDLSLNEALSRFPENDPGEDQGHPRVMNMDLKNTEGISFRSRVTAWDIVNEQKRREEVQRKLAEGEEIEKQAPKKAKSKGKSKGTWHPIDGSWGMQDQNRRGRVIHGQQIRKPLGGK